MEQTLNKIVKDLTTIKDEMRFLRDKMGYTMTDKREFLKREDRNE